MGIGEIDLDELLFIASDPDSRHVFLLDSFNDAPNFVDFLSFTTCDGEWQVCTIEGEATPDIGTLEGRNPKMLF